METEQAHSSRIYSGRDAVPQWRDPRRANSSDGAQKRLRIPQWRDAVPTVWLSLVCLDAPLVAVAWLWLFARTFRTTVDPVSCAALFLTAWLIYLADRLADSWTLPGAELRSLRQEFCVRHRSIWIAALTVITIADAALIWNLGPATFLAGAIVGILALIHLVLNYSLGGAWPPLPLKEAAVGSLFAAGTLVPLFPSLSPITGSLIFSGIAFGLVCTLNCICIAFWERELDETQRKVSFATRFPSFRPNLGKLSIALALSSAVSAVLFRDAAPVFGCVGVSALLLALLDSWRGRINRDQRVALADLVLLTPLLALLVMKA